MANIITKINTIIDKYLIILEKQETVLDLAKQSHKLSIDYHNREKLREFALIEYKINELENKENLNDSEINELNYYKKLRLWRTN